MKRIVILLIVCITTLYVNAQWGRLGNKVADKVADHMLDKAADAIADKIISSWNEAEQEALRRDYDSIQKENPEAYEDFEDYKKSLNKNPNVQDEYKFDIWVNVESTDGKEKDDYQLYYSKESALMGMKTVEEATAFTVIDYDKDMMVIYSEEDGKKYMQALPSFQRLAGKIVYTASEEAGKTSDFSFEKTGKTKTIAGYECDEYSGTNEDGPFMMYMASGFPVNWNDVYGKFYSQYLFTENNTPMNDLSGMMMYYYSMNRKGKILSSWEVKSVSEEKFIIHTDDYLND